MCFPSKVADEEDADHVTVASYETEMSPAAIVVNWYLVCMVDNTADVKPTWETCACAWKNFGTSVIFGVITCIAIKLILFSC